MFPVPPERSVGLIGVLVQLGACLLATTLVIGVEREQRHREYLVWWSRAWIAISIAISVISLRYLIIPQVAPDAVREIEGPALWPLYLVYQTAKLLFIGFLALGVRSLTTDRPVTRREGVAVTAGAGLVGFASVLVSRDLNLLVMIQCVVAVPVFAVLAWEIGRPRAGPLPFGRRTLTVALVLHAILWTQYLQGFGFALAGSQPIGGYRLFLAYVTGYNSYLDAGLATVLGIGMVLTLVEQVHREAESLKDTRLRAIAAVQLRLAAVLRGAREGIITLDRERRIDLINPAAETILALPVDAARGQSFDRFVAEADRAQLWGERAPAAVAARIEVSGVRATGEGFPFELSLSSLDDDGGRGYVIVLRDLTEQLREREAHSLLQQQLAQAARLEAVGRLVSGVAHELNNPLTAIIAFAQDLAANPRSEEDREALNVIIQQGDRCRVIVGDLLILARSRREERRQLRPGELVPRVARVFERDSIRDGVALDIEVAPDLPPIEVDPAGIEQVLTNLLTNAFQASKGGGRIRLSVGQSGDRVEYRVEDQGAGIAPTVMPRLFEPFFTTKGPGEGTGLGLAVSHTIIEQHGGSIVAENRTEPGGGARFIVRLPVAAPRPEPAREIPLPSARPDRAAREQRRALVVDDEPAIRAAIRRTLERRGWTVDEAGDGEEAWLLLDRPGDPARYQAIVTDLRMPGTSGITLMERLRATYPALADRTLVITGDTASPQVAEFLASLPTPYLQKPFEMRTVVDRLEGLLARVEAQG
jgi:PAS domain S-box-containing protein